MNIVEDLSDVPFILFGDVNTWTGKETPESDELTEFPFNIFEDRHDDTVRISKRTSKDKEVNDFGRCLSNVCNQFGFQITKGTMCGDECGYFTSFSSADCSLIEHFIVQYQDVSFCLCPCP